MSSRNQRPVGKLSAAVLFYILAIGSGIARSFSVAFDVVALNLTDIDPITYGFMAQWVSFGISFILLITLSIRISSDGRTRKLGYHLDPDFERMRLLPRRPMLYLVCGGLVAGISTFFYYFLVEQTNITTVLPYGQLVIIYLLLGDLVAEKDTPTIVEVQCIVSILFGVLLVGVTPGGFDILALAIVLGPMNVSSALFTYFQRKTKRYEIRKGLRVDALNMRLWSLFFLNLSMSVTMLPFMGLATWNVMSEYFAPLFWLMAGSSLTIFVSMVLYVRALGKGSMSIVNSLSAVSVLVGIPLTLIGNWIVPGAFGQVSGDTFIWILRVLGILLVLIGIVALQAADVRSFVFIKVKPHTGDLLPDLFDVKGVETAAAIAGKHDYILSIKSRSLAKTRNLVLKRIQQIPGIEEIETQVIIKDFR
ncbi:MAG: Lrp/AsnC ligand binding domain-containing protein [Candidatus Thorarchaeota archaeon]|nr:MAG: Lrp/AsnC ligand binding domain-containing protein [Candidatus Thorarchaeota archaeon]